MTRNEIFLEVCDRLSQGEEVPYYLESKIFDLSLILETEEISEILHFIMLHGNAANTFRYLNRKQVLKNLLPDIYNLVSVPQKKGRARNAFEHTMNVIEAVPIDIDYLRWVALLHDTGKYYSYMEDGDFKSHATYSYNYSKAFLTVFGISNDKKILVIVKNHMFPLDYQRMPNWTDKAVDTFIDRCGEEHAIDTIQFSIYDKMAENNYSDFLQPLYDLKERTESRINGRKTSN